MTSQRKGFTVLEVMIAMAILFLAIVTLASGYLDVLNAYAKIEDDTDFRNDLRFARASLMAEPDFDTAEKGAEFETTNGHRVAWKATIEPTNVADLFAVTFECEVNAPELKEPMKLTEKFRLLRPTWSKPEERERLRADARSRILQEQGGGAGGDSSGGNSGASSGSLSSPRQSSSPGSGFGRPSGSGNMNTGSGTRNGGARGGSRR